VEKEVVRQGLLTKLSLLSTDEIYSLSFALTNQLIKLFHSIPELSSQIGAAYLPFKVELAPVFQELLRQMPVSLSYPILKEGQMKFAIPQGLPRGSAWLDPPYVEVEPEWLLVPGLGFDWSGARLGRGGGFYDRYLEDKEALRIGLCWSEQIVEKIPVDSHDCYMDFIITEKFCWDVDQQEKF
jgi:5-formyltetrahydrofolate cyclo-ligase